MATTAGAGLLSRMSLFTQGRVGVNTIMLPTLAMVFFAVPSGILAYVCMRRWPQRDLTAPKIAPGNVATTVERHRFVRHLARSGMDPATETGLVLLVAVIVVIVGGSAVGALAWLARSNEAVQSLDRHFANWGASHSSSTSTSILKWVSMFGGYVGVIVVTVVTAIVEYRRHLGRSVIPLLLIVAGGQFAVANLIKSIVARARPDVLRLTGFSGSSFPSGHAVAASATFAVIALLLGRQRSTKVRAMLGGVSIAIAVAVGVTRVLLGVHWLSDVLAGLMLGWAWFALISIAFGGRVLRFGEPLAVAKAADQALHHGASM